MLARREVSVILVLAQILLQIFFHEYYVHQIWDMVNINIRELKFKIILQQITVMDQMKQNKLSRDNLGREFFK